MSDKKRPGVGVGVMILTNGKVLLGKRLSGVFTDPHGHCWSLPGGKLEFGERPEICGIRETQEECGLVLRPESLKLVSVSNDNDRESHFITLGFLTTLYEGEPRALEPDKTSEWRWFDINELPNPMFYPSARVIQNYLSKTLYKNDLNG